MRRFFGPGAPGNINALASGHRNSQSVTGSRAAVGSIVPGANFQANDTVTINGVVFTAVAAGAAGNQFDIGVDLGASLDNLETVLNASEDADVALATYANVADTSLSVTLDAPGVAGNEFTLATDRGTANAPVGGSNADAWDVDQNAVFFISTAAGANMDFVLPDPSAADACQEITLYFASKGGSAEAVITGDLVGGGTLTLDTEGEFVKLLWVGDGWAPMINSGGAIA